MNHQIYRLGKGSVAVPLEAWFDPYLLVREVHLLMSHPGHVYKAEEIMRSVWGMEQADLTLLKNVVYRLRRKLEEGTGKADLIQTRPGGYGFLET